MTMTRRRLLLTTFLIASALGLASPALRAQSIPITLEGYAVADKVTASPARSTTALSAPYRAVGMGTDLLIVDETDPAHPLTVAQLTLPSPALSMLLRDGNLYIAAGSSGIVILDVSNPVNPRFVSSIAAGRPVAIAINSGGKILYACDGSEVIQIINIEKPTQPKKVRDVAFAYARFWDLAVVGKHLITAAGPKGIVVYSLEHPGVPIRVKHFKDLTATRTLSSNPGQETLFAVADDYEGLVFLNFPTWTTPAIKGTLATPAQPTMARYMASSDRVLVGLGAAGFAIVDGTDPTAPTIISQPTTPSPVMGVSTDGGHPALLCSGAGFYSLDVTNPADPIATLTLPGSSPFGAVAALGNTVFVSRESTLEVWDAGDPHHLALLNSIPTPAFATDLLLSGSLLFAGCQQSGVVIFDVTTPTAPVQISTVAVEGAAGQMDIRGGLLAIADGSDGAILVDVSNPVAPVKLGDPWKNKKDDFVSGVAFSSATTLWVRGNISGVTGLNITNPVAPAELGSLTQDNNSGRLYFVANYLYSMGGLSVLTVNVTDSTKPASAGQLSTDGALYASIYANTLFLADGAVGCAEVDISNPESPYMFTYFASPTFGYQGVILPNGARLVSAREGGLYTLLKTNCDGALLFLPCEGAELSPFGVPIFTWKSATDAKYALEISTSSSFPSGQKTFTTTIAGKYLSNPYYQLGSSAWANLVNRARKGDQLLYWRVTYKNGKHKVHSETRTVAVH